MDKKKLKVNGAIKRRLRGMRKLRDALLSLGWTMTAAPEFEDTYIIGHALPVSVIKEALVELNSKGDKSEDAVL